MAPGPESGSPDSHEASSYQSHGGVAASRGEIPTSPSSQPRSALPEASSSHDQGLMAHAHNSSNQNSRPAAYSPTEQTPLIANHASSQSPSKRGKARVDTNSLDFGLLRWTRAMRKRMKDRRRRRLLLSTHGVKEILASVFEYVPPDPNVPWPLYRTLDHQLPGTKTKFHLVVESVRTAISKNVQPRMNRLGSSGSYFARDSSGQTVGIFKPKDEEPYGRLNPKYTKWIHRNLLAPIIGFGRACLIPNLSYQSEAAASVLDRLLQTHIVPHTEVVDLSSPSFFYDWIDRRAAKLTNKNPRPLPPKQGSFQLFLKGYQDASEFLRKHPWPGRPPSDTFNPAMHRHRRRLGKLRRSCLLLCGKSEDFELECTDECEGDDDWVPNDGNNDTSRGEDFEANFRWTKELMQDFKEQLERLVILDFLIRNTDRGLDNFMIKACPGNCSNVSSETDEKFDDYSRPHIHVAAIDNSLAFPHQHPKGWRNYTYGWLWLPVSIIGKPFSEKTRAHFLPLLSSPQWWAKTTAELRKQFSTDKDFSPKMFRKQTAVVKGQGWNVVESLKHQDEGPLELCRRRKVLVWDDEVEVPLSYNVDSQLSDVFRPLSFTNGDQSDNGGNTLSIPHGNKDLVSINNNQQRDSPATSRVGRPTLPHSFSYNPSRIDREPGYLSMSLSGIDLESAKVSDMVDTGRPLPTAKEVDLRHTKFGSLTGIAMMEHMEERQRDERSETQRLSKDNTLTRSERFAVHGGGVISSQYDENDSSTRFGYSRRSLSEEGSTMPRDHGKSRRRSSLINWASRRRTQWGWKAETTDDGRITIVPCLPKSLDDTISSARRKSADDEVDVISPHYGQANDHHRSLSETDEGEAQERYLDDGISEDARSVTSEVMLPAAQHSDSGESTKVVVVERLEEIIANPTFTHC